MINKINIVTFLTFWMVFTTSSYTQDEQSITAFADVTVSDGLTYSVVTSYLDKERVIFHRKYSDRQITTGRAGFYNWQYDGEVESAISKQSGDIVSGHQFHAQIIYPDSHYGDDAKITSREDSQCQCIIITVKDGMRTITRRFAKENNRPISQLTDYNGEFSVLLTYKDWQQVGNIELPHRIDIDDGTRTFIYKYSKIEFNKPDFHSGFYTPYAKLTDKQKLLRHHLNMIDAHIASDEALMSDQWGDDITFIYNGKVETVKKVNAANNMHTSLKARSHSKYVDLDPPVITLSEDKTLGWIIVRIRAEGNRLDEKGIITEPLAFTSAWVSLYKKIDGHWKMVGNVSTLESKE